MEHDHGSSLGIQPEEAAFELVTVGDARFEAGDRRGDDRSQLDVDAVAAQPLGLVDRRANRELVQPGIEAIRVPERGQITPGSDERVLHGVLGLFGVPEDQPGSPVET